MLPYAPSADAITRMDYNVLEALPLLRPLISCHGETLHLTPCSCLLSAPNLVPGRNGKKSPTDPGLQRSWLSPKVLCADSWGQTPPPAGWWHPRNSFQWLVTLELIGLMFFMGKKEHTDSKNV